MYDRLIVLVVMMIASRRCVGAFRSTGLLSTNRRVALFSSSSTEKKQRPWSPPKVEHEFTPWNRPEEDKPPSRKKNSRFRQHVNPLSSLYQMQTPLSEDWPHDVFEDLSQPLHLDIGCGKGGFLLELAKERPESGVNYLGLEIRPDVTKYAQERVGKRGLTGRVSFVGCNANVDLDRLLSLLHAGGGGGPLELVSIQFPDPHFKAQHKKRRVVTPALVQTLAKFMPPKAVVFLQSDIQEVLDEMRLEFRECTDYFEDELQDETEYMPENFVGVPTEREVSVLEKDLPVFRTIFRRTEAPFQSSDSC